MLYIFETAPFKKIHREWRFFGCFLRRKKVIPPPSPALSQAKTLYICLKVIKRGNGDGENHRAHPCPKRLARSSKFSCCFVGVGAGAGRRTGGESEALHLHAPYSGEDIDVVEGRREA